MLDVKVIRFTLIVGNFPKVTYAFELISLSPKIK